LLGVGLVSCMAVSLRTTWIGRIATAVTRLLATVAPRNAETDLPSLGVV
jgi:hypothetical protein